MRAKSPALDPDPGVIARLPPASACDDEAHTAICRAFVPRPSSLRAPAPLPSRRTQDPLGRFLSAAPVIPLELPADSEQLARLVQAFQRCLRMGSSSVTCPGMGKRTLAAPVQPRFPRRPSELEGSGGINSSLWIAVISDLGEDCHVSPLTRTYCGTTRKS